MTDTAAVSGRPQAATAVATQGTAGGLQTATGTTTIADGVVTKIAVIAVREVDGVHKLGGGVARALGSVTQRLAGGESHSQGVSVEADETRAAVEVTVVVEYGASIPDVAEQIRETVIRRVEGLSGLQVTQVNIEVDDLHFAADDDDDQ